MALTGCVQHGDRVFRCRSGDGDTRATIKALRDDPNIYNVTVHAPPPLADADRHGRARSRRSMVTMQQNTLQRTGQIGTCVPRGEFSLTCHMP